jgi:predicted RNA-binding protein YlxR (DUF448 family)
MVKAGHIPMRRCLGCRKRRRKDELIRLAYVEGSGLVVDMEQRMPGRGAYLCNDDLCLRRGLDGKAISNAFKKRVTIDGEIRKSIEYVLQGSRERSRGIRVSLASAGGER